MPPELKSLELLRMTNDLLMSAIIKINSVVVSVTTTVLLLSLKPHGRILHYIP